MGVWHTFFCIENVFIDFLFHTSRKQIPICKTVSLYTNPVGWRVSKIVMECCSESKTILIYSFNLVQQIQTGSLGSIDVNSV